MIETIEAILMWFGLIVGAATSIVLALEKIAEVTPTTKDDEYISKAKKALGYLSSFLDYFNIYTTKDKLKKGD